MFVVSETGSWSLQQFQRPQAGIDIDAILMTKEFNRNDFSGQSSPFSLELPFSIDESIGRDVRIKIDSNRVISTYSLLKVDIPQKKYNNDASCKNKFACLWRVDPSPNDALEVSKMKF